MNRLIGAALVVVIVSTILSAQQPQPNHPYVAYGPTRVSCGTWVALSQSDRSNYEWWALGFVSGASRELALQNIHVTETDPNGITGWITKYCSDHPLADMVAAVVGLVNELKNGSNQR